MPGTGTVRSLLPAGPCGQSVAMQRLVSSILNCTPSLTWRLSASLSLGSASTRRSLACNNLRQLPGFQTVGNGVRQGRQMAGNWARLHSVRALRRLTRALVPVVGSNAIRIFKRCCQESRRADVDFKKMPKRGLLKHDGPKLQGSVSSNNNKHELLLGSCLTAHAASPSLGELPLRMHVRRNEPTSTSTCRCGASACAEAFIRCRQAALIP